MDAAGLEVVVAGDFAVVAGDDAADFAVAGEVTAFGEGWALLRVAGRAMIDVIRRIDLMRFIWKRGPFLLLLGYSSSSVTWDPVRDERPRRNARQLLGIELGVWGVSSWSVNLYVSKKTLNGESGRSDIDGTAAR